MRFVFVIIGVLSVAVCGTGCGTCTNEGRFGLTVTVTDAASGAPICDATVRVTGSVAETAMSVGSGADCAYVALLERPGTFDVEAAHDTYVSRSEMGVTLEHDGCHVIGKQLAIALRRSDP